MSMGGGGYTPPPPKVEAPPPPPAPMTMADAKVQYTPRARNQRAMAGFQGTIATSPSGLTAPANTAQKTLLGG